MQSDSFWYQWVVQQPWVIEIFIAVVFLFILNIVLKKGLNQLQKKAHLTENDWRSHLDYAAVAPARVLIWILLVSVIVDLIIRKFELSGVFLYFLPLRNATIIICVAWFLMRWKKVIHLVVKNRSDRKSNIMAVDPFTLEILGKIFTILVLFLTVLIVMQIFGLNIVPLITFGGIGAATLGFAGKDAISNFFGGMMIYLTRPFIVNDMVEISDLKIQGNIEEIGWYLTSIRDVQKKPIYVPNSIFSTKAVINHSRITHRRIEESIGIRYEDLARAPKILENIQTLLERHPTVDQHLPIHIFLQSFAPSSIQLEIRVYLLCTRYEDFMEVRQKILMEIYRIIHAEGGEMPFPVMHVNVKNVE